ncbi:NAD(P)-dependent oxidoreductase [Microbacterium sp. LWS13-1.2]|uniref:NAD(P)-dependent oxidoreductase n=1 Tax=Microbacterium sp. LWS13-1.2 TaxID=3135264 RepID=A0AAU6S8M9_9MICO
MSPPARIGFVGLGDQGAPIAQAIIDGGYPLHVWARHSASLGALGNRKFTVHESPGDMAKVSELVALCLPEDTDVLQLVVDGGLLAGMQPESILVNHGTGLPETARHLAGLGAVRNVDVLDAPVSGGNAVARVRQLTTIVGGTDDGVARARAIFDTFSKSVIHVGPAGSGQYGKLFNNALMMMNHQNVIEVVNLALRLDLPVRSLIEVLRSGSASSFALQAIGPSITVDNVEHLASLELIDMDLFSAATASLGQKRMPVVERALAGANGLSELTRLTQS